MVKRLRRRPLTAKTGVRVPLGLPSKKPLLSTKGKRGFLVAFIIDVWYIVAMKRKMKYGRRRHDSDDRSE